VVFSARRRLSAAFSVALPMQTRPAALVALIGDDERIFKALEGTCLRRDVCKLVKADPGRIVATAVADPPDLIVLALDSASRTADSARLLGELAGRSELDAVPILALDFGGEAPRSLPERSAAVDILKMRPKVRATSGGLDSRLDEAIQRHLPALKRIIDRVAVDLPVRCRRRGAIFTVRTKNISPSGLFLTTERALAPGERIEVRFALPPAARRRLPSRTSVSATCMVVRRVEPESDDTQDLIAGVGVRFLDLDNQVRGVLQHFVSEGGRRARPARTAH